MRKVAASLLMLTLVAVPAAAAVQEAPQQEQQEYQQVEGTLDSVDLEAETVGVTDGSGSSLEVTVSEETVITDPDGYELTLADLAQQEGADVRVTYRDSDTSMDALSIELLA
ncbi:MAG: hypothetical protein ACOC5E_00840 [Acidobacteriota bacterium]